MNRMSGKYYSNISLHMKWQKYLFELVIHIQLQQYVIRIHTTLSINQFYFVTQTIELELFLLWTL